MKIRLLIDCKNLALYGGGIAHWIKPLLAHWFRDNEQHEFICVHPAGQGLKKVNLEGCQQYEISWPNFLPRNFRHPYYDNWQFPKVLKQIAPQLLFSPYHDVRLPKKNNSLYTIITVHDLCFLDAPKSYPFFIRHYYLWMLQINIKRAHHIITVSQATKQRLLHIFSLTESMISVIPNTLENVFGNYIPLEGDVKNWRKRYGEYNKKIVLYSGGLDYRKNISRLIRSFRLLWHQGYAVTLCITGVLNPKWQQIFSQEELCSKKVQFLGFLSLTELRHAYEAVDGVVYPSLCEGFGRACLEAMACGTPLACSDLPVFREVANDYAYYFDPLDEADIANAIRKSLEAPRPQARRDCRYELTRVQSHFVQVMDQLLDNAKRISMDVD